MFDLGSVCWGRLGDDGRDRVDIRLCPRWTDPSNPPLINPPIKPNTDVALRRGARSEAGRGEQGRRQAGGGSGHGLLRSAEPQLGGQGIVLLVFVCGCVICGFLGMGGAGGVCTTCNGCVCLNIHPPSTDTQVFRAQQIAKWTGPRPDESKVLCCFWFGSVRLSAFLVYNLEDAPPHPHQTQYNLTIHDPN